MTELERVAEALAISNMKRANAIAAMACAFYSPKRLRRRMMHRKKLKPLDPVPALSVTIILEDGTEHIGVRQPNGMWYFDVTIPAGQSFTSEWKWTSDEKD